MCDYVNLQLPVAMVLAYLIIPSARRKKAMKEKAQAMRFSFDGTMPGACQMAGIHTGTWNGAESTAFSFSGMSADPLTDTTTGSELNLTEVRWERSAGLKSGQADRFSAGEARAVVTEGGPFGLTNPNGAVTLCIYEVATMNNINTGESVEFPVPMAFSCN